MSDIQQKDMPQGNSDEDILKRARARYALCEEAEKGIRKDYQDDVRFCKGDQWPENVKNSRSIDDRPCLTINLLPEMLHQVGNEMRQNRAAIKINPVDDGADVETAEVLQGMIRHIEYISKAEVAYDTACDGQRRGGFGYFRILTEYCSPKSFDVDIKIKRIRDPLAVRLDPNYTEPDGSDAEYGFIEDSMSKEEFLRTYPGSKSTNFQNWGQVAKKSDGWMNKDTVRVAEYIEKQYTKTKIFELSDGRVVEAQELTPESLQGLKNVEGKIPTIVRFRETQIATVMWYKINGLEILDRTKLHGTYIPIVPVLGEEYYDEGERTLESLIRHSKDPQRMYNYSKTAATEMIALAPKAPFIGYEGQFEGHEDKWKSANKRNISFLEHKVVVLPNGQAAPPPQRNQYEAPVSALNVQIAGFREDLRATTGVQDASVGNISQELSGRAIERRVNQANISNFHFSDNFKRSLRHAGCILLEWIPKVYNKPQAVRVLGADDQQRIVRINEIFEENGENKGYFLGKGEYDVTVDTGPSYQTKRQEGVAAMTELQRNDPEAMRPALDIMVRQMDFPEAEKISERINMTLPPEMRNQDDKKKNPITPEAQAIIGKSQQMLEAQSKLIAEQDEIIRTKKLEIESKERLEQQKLKNDIVIEFMKHDLAGAKAIMEAEISQIDKRMELLHEQARIVMNPGDGPAGGTSQGQENNPTGGVSPG